MPGVVISYLFPQDVAGRFCDSLARLVRYDSQGPQHITGEQGGLITLQSGPRVAEGRSQIVDLFLNNYDAEWLLMLDSDMTFESSLVEELMAWANPKTVPILGGLCFAGGHDSGRMFPTVYKETEVDGAVWVEPVEDYPPNRLVKVGATGGACVLVHRQVFIAMAHPHPKGFGTFTDGRRNPYPWYTEGLTGAQGQPWGEDVSFCRKARMLGIPVHVHTGIKLGHVKSYILDDKLWLEHKAKAAQPTDRASRRRAARELARAT